MRGTKTRDNLFFNMDIDLEFYLRVPPEVMFPLELNMHLREVIKKLNEEKWELKEKLECEDIELRELQKYKEETKQMMDVLTSGSNSLMSSKFIELSKKNRDMCWQNEGMKSKLSKIMAENECYREKINNLETNGSFQNTPGQTQSTEERNSIGKSDEEYANLNHQLTKATNKMMEYRRQNQVTQQELRTALRALAQEVGEGVTPKNVLKEVASVDSTWRGRQQQIMALQQKLMDAQLKINAYQQREESLGFDQQQSDIGTGTEGGDLSCASSCKVNDQGAGDFTTNSSKLERKITAAIPVTSSASKRCLVNLRQHDMKKREQIEKLAEELEATQEDLKSVKLEAKGLRARNNVLEGQIRSLRIELDDVGVKLGLKQELLAESAAEVQQIRTKLLEVREQDKQFRDNTLAELKEANQSLTRERGVVLRLQSMLAERDSSLLKLDGEIAKLNDDLQVYARNSFGTLEASQKIKSLETQLQYSTQSIQTAEKERERLLNSLLTANREIKKERRLHCDTEILLGKSIGVLKKADDCIKTCLDAGDVTSRCVLKEVEDLRTAIRQIKVRNDERFETSEEIQKSPRLTCALNKEAAVLDDYIKNAAKTRDSKP